LIRAQEFPVTELEMRHQRSWIVVTPDGRRLYKCRAFAALISCSPIFSWFGALVRQHQVAAIGDRLYDMVEGRRERLSDWTDWIKPRRMSLRTSWPVSIFALFFIVYVSFWNLGSVVRLPGQPFGEMIGL